MLKRCISIILSLLLVLELGFSEAVKADSSKSFQAIYEAVNEFYSIINDKDFELDENDSLFIGNEIPAYSYMEDESFKLCSNHLYPVFRNDELQLFVTVYPDGNVDVTQALVSSLKEYCENRHNITLIYDRNGCYVYDKDDSSMNEIYSSSHKDQTRGVLEENSVSVGLLLSGIISPEKKIIRDNNAKSGYYAMTSVTWVYQGTNDNLCWAASIASIGNYLTGSSYTVADVCYAYPGYIPSDYGMISMFLVCHALNQRYPSISYPSYSDNYVPSGTYMYNNLSNNYPMFGCFQFPYGSNIGYHCCVIRGINNNTGKLYIIDPHYGYQVVNKSGGVYSYESLHDNCIYTLIGYGAKL